MILSYLNLQHDVISDYFNLFSKDMLSESLLFAWLLTILPLNDA